MSVLLEHAAQGLALLDRLTDAAHRDDMAPWDLLADPADVTDADVRAAVTVAITAGLECAPTSPSTDAAAKPRHWLPPLFRFVDAVLGDMAADEVGLPAVRRRDLEPIDWGARLMLWLMAVAFARREQLGEPRRGGAG